MRLQDFISEAPLPPEWDAEQMKKQKGTTFKSRLAYAVQRSERLGTGSSRVAVKIEENGRPTVLKIAKNRKGEAQNKEEISLLSDGYIRSIEIAIPMIDYDKTSDIPVWIQTEYARVPNNEKELCSYFGCRNLWELVAYAKAYTKKMGHDIQQRLLRDIEEEKQEIFLDYANNLADLVQFGVELVDFNNYKNWGFYNGRPVVIDLGYAGEVLELYRR